MTLKLPSKLLSDASVVASGQDVTIGHLVRHLLAKEVDRRLDPKRGGGPEGGLIPALQTLLARDIAEADGWDDLDTRLAAQGYELRPEGRGVALYKRSCGTRVCKGSELGVSINDLARRFGVTMPGHPDAALRQGTTKDEATHHNLDSTQKGRLQRSLGPVFKTASDWEMLADRLLRRGYVLRAQGTGLAIYGAQDGKHLCNAATVGYRYRALVKRFGAPMPGHPHGKDWVRKKNARPEPVQDELEFEVIDREWRGGTAQTQNAPALGRGV